MKRTLKLLTLGLIASLSYSCGETKTFEQQITDDVVSKMGTGICDSIPNGANITNVKIGEIVPIGETGLIDVSLEFDYEINQKTTHKKEAVLYSKAGNSYRLEALGGCDYERAK